MKYIIYFEKGIMGFTEAESREEVARKLDLTTCEYEDGEIICRWRSSIGADFERKPDVFVEIIDISELPEISYPYQLDKEAHLSIQSS